MSSFAKATLLLTAICMTWTTALSAEEGAVQPPVTDLASPELWIDGPDNVQPGFPSFPDVAVDNDGIRIHVWEGFDVVDRQDIFLRRFDANGNPLEDPRMVNTTIANAQIAPRVAVSADGSFLVIYQSLETPSGQTFDQFMIRSQAFNANGNPVGGEQLVSIVPTHNQTDNFPDVAALRTADGSPGGYVVAWRNSQSLGNGWGDIYGSLVSTAGVPGAEFRLNPADNDTERGPSVTELKDGGFLVVWHAFPTVWGRRFNSAGGPMGPKFAINTLASAAPSLATDAAIGWDGRVLVVWEDDGAENPPLPATSATGEIRGRVLDAEVNPLGIGDFRINDLHFGRQRDPRIADLGPVGFLVVWNSDTVSAGPDTTQSVEARVVSGPNAFDADGDGTNENQIQYNVWDNDAGQNSPSAHGWYGQVANSWQSNSWDGEPEPDTINQLFVIGRDLDSCIFCDDFEWFDPASSGSFWRWARALNALP